MSEDGSNALLATVTDFDATEDTLLIDFATTQDPDAATEGYVFNKDITFTGTVSGDEQENFDMHFTLTAQNAAGEELTRTLTVRLIEDGTNLEFDFLNVTETATGMAITLDQTVAAAA